MVCGKVFQKHYSYYLSFRYLNTYETVILLVKWTLIHMVCGILGL